MVKTFSYRGGTRTFSNRYHFNGGTPSDSAHWTTFSDAVTAAEKLIYPAPVNGGATITETVGYAAGSEVPVFSKVYALAGTLVPASGVSVPGDVAALVRYSTSGRTSKNHPIYLFNYYHAVLVQNVAASSDNLMTNQKTAMGVYASAWITGFSDGTNTLVRSGPNGHLALGQLVEAMVTHRDLPHG